MNSTLAALDAKASWQFLRDARDEDIPLLWAALQIARDEYPDLDPAAYEAIFAAHSDAVRARIGRADDSLDTLRALHGVLFEEQGYTGNDQDYYDPRNSYLNDVIERRTGNPIALSVLELDLARRVGLPLQGVSFPGHFLIRLPVDNGLLVLDPFNKGRSLDAGELRVRAKPHVPGRTVDDEQLGRMLEPAPTRTILTRMLRNLRQSYVEREEFERALRCADRIVWLDDRDPEEIRERGLLYARVGHVHAARDDLRCYLAALPQAEDNERIHQILVELGSRAGRLN
ncbi:MAG TPA: tetratricopeptide repeat protein [Patescibacteria group bacterium]|nr:tetratricopeptide repeat protein [Patescibacteria group bacterium]